MSTIETHISINAPPSKVWSILTDFPTMPSWNPFITAISGTVSPGSRLSVTIAPPGQSGMTFTPAVLTATPGRELRWLGTVLSRWIFAGEHYFLLEPASDGVTRLTHGERFSGMLAPLIMRTRALNATKDGFVAMNEALKRRSEYSSLLARLAIAGPIILSGDIAHYRYNMENRCVPSFNFDAALSRESMERIDALAQKAGAQLWLNHDIVQTATLPHAPAHFS